MEHLVRTKLLLGGAAMEKLSNSRVAVFGLGGVGGHCVEALARSGVGALDLVDGDRIAESNLNRQILATRSTVGMLKTDAARARVADIDPAVSVRCRPLYFLPETEGQFDFSEYDFVVDAVDMVTAKLLLAQRAMEAGVPIVSCMGAGNKLDPSRFRVSDIAETSVCPLARVMRRELRTRGIAHLPVVWSDEKPRQPLPGKHADPEEARRRATPGSTAFVPGAAGLVLAGYVVRELTRGLVPEAEP